VEEESFPWNPVRGDGLETLDLEDDWRETFGRSGWLEEGEVFPPFVSADELEPPESFLTMLVAECFSRSLSFSLLAPQPYPHFFESLRLDFVGEGSLMGRGTSYDSESSEMRPALGKEVFEVTVAVGEKESWWLGS